MTTANILIHQLPALVVDSSTLTGSGTQADPLTAGGSPQFISETFTVVSAPTASRIIPVGTEDTLITMTIGVTDRPATPTADMVQVVAGWAALAWQGLGVDIPSSFKLNLVLSGNTTQIVLAQAQHELTPPSGAAIPDGSVVLPCSAYITAAQVTTVGTSPRVLLEVVTPASCPVTYAGTGSNPPARGAITVVSAPVANARTVAA